MKRPPKSIFLTLVVLLTSFIAATYGFGIYLFPAIAPEMIKDINFTYLEMGVTTGAVQAGFLISALLSGLLTNILGALRIIKASIVICALCLFGLTWASNFILISFFLIVLGGVAASVWTPMVEVSQRYISPKHQGKALGLMSSGTSYGVFLNGFLIHFLLDDYGWRSLWLITFAILLILCIWTFASLRKTEHVRHSYDDIKSDNKSNPFTKLMKLPKGMTSIIMLMMFLNGLSCLPFQTYLSSFLVSEQGLDIGQSATAWQVIGITGTVGGFIMGWVADRITVRWALTVVYVFLSASTILLLYFDTGSYYLYLMAFLFGMAFYAIFGLMPAYISHIYKGGTAAIVFALGNVSLGMGGIVGNALGGWLKGVYGSFEWIYVVILTASLASMMMSIVMRNEQKVSYTQ
jgi:predicted MFS family arabinose efflux permease